MKNVLFCLAIAVSLFFVCAQPAQASIVLNFDPPAFTPDTANGDHAHTYSTAYGDITFNGRIWDHIDSRLYPDHTTGYDYFLKNTGAAARVEMTFSFDVEAIDFYWLGVSGKTMNGAVYDISGVLLASGTELGTGAWIPVVGDIGGYLSPIRKIAFWTTPGNLMAVDDMTISVLAPSVIPEPATMVLLGSGLLGLAGLRKRKK